MRIVKILKQFKIPRWSTVLSCVFYIIFMSLILCMTFPLKSSSPNKLLNRNDVDELKKSEFHRLTKKSEMNEGAIKGDTNTVILSNSMDGTKILKTTFYRFVDYIFNSLYSRSIMLSVWMFVCCMLHTTLNLFIHI